MCWWRCCSPYLRKFGQYLIPDFLRCPLYGQHRAQWVWRTILASFVYVVAQICNVGLIASQFLSVEFESACLWGWRAFLCVLPGECAP